MVMVLGDETNFGVDFLALAFYFTINFIKKRIDECRTFDPISHAINNI